jgi:hypothetical protein
MRIALRSKLLFASALTLAVSPAVAQNYNATAGSGLIFGAKLGSGSVLFPYFIPCDATTATQCLAINASGQITVLPGNTANTTPWLMSVTQGGNTATVKAASTAAAATDPSLVSNESPNSQLSVATGTTADAAYTSGNGSMVSILKGIYAGTTGSIPAGTNTIGDIGSDPSAGKATPQFTFLGMPATTTTQMVALSGSTRIYVTSMMAFSGGTANLTFKYGTGSNCGTGTATLAGPYPLTAQAGFTLGSGIAAVMIVPSSQALCVTTDATVTGGVQITYQQF